MELRKGFKQTTLGQIPFDWNEIPFRELSWYQEGPGLRNWQFTSEGIKVINVTNLVEGFLNLERTARHISWNEFEKMYKHFEIDAGDIVVASSGNSYAKVAVVRKKDLPLVMNTSVIRFKPLTNLDYNFLLAFLKSNSFKNQIDLLITGGAQPNFGPFHLNKILINVPSTKAEQTAIANALSDADALISSLEKLIEKKRNIKQGAMQQLLKPKKGWVKMSIDEICVQGGIVRGPFGGALKKESFVDKGFKVYEQKNAIYQSVQLGNYYVDYSKFNELKRFEIKEGDFIISCSGTIGKIFQIPKTYEKGIINQALLKLTIDSNRVSENYFYHYFSWENFQAIIIDSTQGGAMKNLIGMSEFRKTIIPSPQKLNEQKEIATILSDMDNEITSLEKKLTKSKMLKQGMMQELLTGKIRLV